MKKSFFAILFLVSIMSFSQTQTKRYNSMTKRYEYFDSRGNMIGYEFYNTMTRQWEYYETKSQNSYQEPAKVDLSPTLNALSILQDRYDNNVQQVQNNINNLSNKIDELNVTDSEKEQIRNAFAKLIAENLSGQRFNYSSASETNRIINWLYESTNKIIKNVTSQHKNVTSQYKSNVYTNSSEIDYWENFYNKKISVDYISIFDKNGRFVKRDNIRYDSYVIIGNNTIEFKRADGSLLYRNFLDKKYNEKKKGYDISTNEGKVFIDQILTYVDFFNNDGSNYTYWLKK